jgi:hypothetical protein
VGDRRRTNDGWGVEVIRMLATRGRHDGESFRVTQHGFFAGYARSVPKLERWVEQTRLEQALRSLARLRRMCTPHAVSSP